MYILSNNSCKCISLASDTNSTLFENYKFPTETEIMKSLTSEFIINKEHENLLCLCE